MTAYLEDILAQPAALRATLEGLAATAPLPAWAHDLKASGFSRLVLTGMGSSFHALHPLLLRLVQQGICAQMIETSELIHHAMALLEAGSLVVAVSQSGKSIEIVQMLKRLGPGCRVIGVTNTHGSPLAQQAGAVVLTRAGAETSVSCKTYLATLAALCWLGDQLVGDPSQAQFSQLSDAPQRVAEYLSGWQEYQADLVQRLRSTRHLFLVGRGASLAAVGTGGLIIKEAAHFPAEGMSSAAFRHGPLEMVSPATFVLVYQGSTETSDLNGKLAVDIQAYGGQAALVKASPEGGAFDLSGDAPALSPLLEILPAQMLSLALAKLGGIEAGHFTRLKKVTAEE